MGIFNVPIGVGNNDGSIFERVDALVDTGATFTIVPSPILRGLGVEPQESGDFELADGSIIRFDIGETLLQVNGVQVNSVVVFGEEGMEPILGALTLERLGLAVDPARKRLLKVPWRLL